ncbi:MAG: glycosyltransferase family 2 protein [Fimbriimonadaceae bacterium]|jgi:hypothetical protein|nr:glycosyltransferase family 2 protein [Fimbriimonadaceae bacterium]
MLSILIVNWNTRDKLQECLTSLTHSKLPFATEIIVVDNASTDGSAEMVKQYFPHIICIESNSNLGYSGGNNLAYQAAKGEWILTLNPDTKLFPDTCHRAILSLSCHPECGALGAQLLNFDNSHQESVRGFPNFWGILGALTHLYKVAPATVWDSYRLTSFNYQESGYAPQPMGTFLLFHRKALESIGITTELFDPAFPIFFNEVDLLKRLHDFGFLCWYDPEVRLYHHHGSSTKQRKKSMIWESHKSLVRYFGKHSRGPERLALPLISLASHLAAFIRARGYDKGFRP